MNGKLLTSLLVSVLLPTVCAATGIGVFYFFSDPKKVTFEREYYYGGAHVTEFYHAALEPLGIGAKGWFNIAPYFAAEGFVTYVPDYGFSYRENTQMSIVGFGGGCKFSKTLDTVIGPIEPYASVGAGAYRTKLEGVITFNDGSSVSTDAGIYAGGGLTVRIAGPLYFDFNPTYSAVFSDDVFYFFDARFGVALII